MIEFEPLRPTEVACAVLATAAIGAGTCALGAAICWRRVNARARTLREWAAAQAERPTSDGGELFDRWQEAARQGTQIRAARVATALWCMAAAIQSGIAALADGACR